MPLLTRITHVFGVPAAIFTAAACGGASRDAGSGQRPASSDTVRVAVAANFAVPHDTLAHRFTTSTGIVVVATLGATGQLYAQIVNGAPVDLLLAADTLRPALLEASGAAVGGTRFTYAAGRLALYAPRQASLLDAPQRLVVPDVRHIAIADPTTAPYGAAAMQALGHWGIADRVGTRIVRGESIAQTFQFVSSGAAEAGFVALSQVIRLPGARYFVVPDSLHDPIRQDAVLLARAKDSAAARKYLDFLKSAEARSVIESFGYSVPVPVVR